MGYLYLLPFLANVSVPGFGAEQLDQTVSVESLEKMTIYFRQLFNVFLATERPDCASLLTNHMHTLMAATGCLIVDVSALQFSMQVYIYYASCIWVCAMLLVGWQEGHPACKKPLGIVGVSPVSVVPTRTVGTSASIIFPCSIKIQKTGGGETQPVCSTALC